MRGAAADSQPLTEKETWPRGPASRQQGTMQERQRHTAPDPDPPGEGSLTSAAGARSRDRLRSAAPPAQAPGGGAAAAARDPRPPRDSRETPPDLAPRHDTAHSPLASRLPSNHKAVGRPPSNHKLTSLPNVRPLSCQPMRGRPTSAPRSPPAVGRGRGVERRGGCCVGGCPWGDLRAHCAFPGLCTGPELTAVIST